MYFPQEDSYFLSGMLKKYLGKERRKNYKVLDMGTGSGILAETLSFFIDKKNILCSDIDEEALKQARKKGFEARKSDLFENIVGKFDLIVFNPPYLADSKYDKGKDTTGGKKGDEVILRFLKQVKGHLKKRGKIFLVLSSITPRGKIEKELKIQKLKKRKIAEKNLFFEGLDIWLVN